MQEISLHELDDLITNHDDVIIVDVREREEYATGHIPGALIVPVGSLENAVDEESIARDEELLSARASAVVVICDDGRRSRVAAGQLARHGFQTVYWLADGLKQWQSAGFPLVT
jgi:rhodanese-related sulfurtransferase